ncbi:MULTISPECIES: hypothetical protein [Moorena]|nr:hypothetical protein [Moorena sp. SIO4G3]
MRQKYVVSQIKYFKNTNIAPYTSLSLPTPYSLLPTPLTPLTPH